MLVAVYSITFMGTCSPIHFRSAAAGIALLCVALSFTASNGFAFLVGGKSAGIHNLLPFLLIGIGVDDCFASAARPLSRKLLCKYARTAAKLTRFRK